MLMGNASKILQDVAANIDRDIFEIALQQLADLVLLTDTTGLLTGEEDISVSGVSVAIQRETQRQRQLEFLQHTGNPIDMSIIGMKGRGAVLRSVSQTIGLDGDVIVPSDDELDKRQAQQQQGSEQQALNQRVEQGIQMGVQLGTQKIASELTSGLLASQAAGPGGPPGLGTPSGAMPPGSPGGPPPGGPPMGAPMAQAAKNMQGNQPSPMSNQNSQPANVVGNQPAPPGPGGRPPAIGGGPG
jgi:hypothetical protein